MSVELVKGTEYYLKYPNPGDWLIYEGLVGYEGDAYHVFSIDGVVCRRIKEGDLEGRMHIPTPAEVEKPEITPSDIMACINDLRCRIVFGAFKVPADIIESLLAIESDVGRLKL